VVSPLCLPLSCRLAWAELSSDPLDGELRAASSTFRLPGETERLFDVPPMVERDPEPPAVAFALAAVAAASCAAIAASTCDDSAGVDRLSGSITLLEAILECFGRVTLASSLSESDIIRPKINQ
jgi:hypothetical protein